MAHLKFKMRTATSEHVCLAHTNKSFNCIKTVKCSHCDKRQCTTVFDDERECSPEGKCKSCPQVGLIRVQAPSFLDVHHQEGRLYKLQAHGGASGSPESHCKTWCSHQGNLATEPCAWESLLLPVATSGMESPLVSLSADFSALTSEFKKLEVPEILPP